MRRDKIDPLVLKKIRNLPYGDYYYSKYDVRNAFKHHGLNCRDEPDDVYNDIFKHLETTTFHTELEVWQELARIYRNHFTFLSFNEFITFINKKYQIVQENQNINVKKRRVI